MEVVSNNDLKGIEKVRESNDGINIHDDCLVDEKYCSMEHNNLVKRLREHFMPHLNKSCDIPHVIWCE